MIGLSNLSSQVASHASFALSNNIINWITEFYDTEKHELNFDFEDEIISSSVLVHNGKFDSTRIS